MRINELTPIVDTEVEMPLRMFDALSLIEIVLCAKGITSISAEDVREYLRREYGDDFAADFHPQYMISNRAVSTTRQ
jgi:hypothetical protein